jgi:hypothetical protein
MLPCLATKKMMTSLEVILDRGAEDDESDDDSDKQELQTRGDI